MAFRARHGVGKVIDGSFKLWWVVVTVGCNQTRFTLPLYGNSWGVVEEGTMGRRRMGRNFIYVAVCTRVVFDDKQMSLPVDNRVYTVRGRGCTCRCEVQDLVFVAQKFKVDANTSSFTWGRFVSSIRKSCDSAVVGVVWAKTCVNCSGKVDAYLYRIIPVHLIKWPAEDLLNGERAFRVGCDCRHGGSYVDCKKSRVSWVMKDVFGWSLGYSGDD